MTLLRERLDEALSVFRIVFLFALTAVLCLTLYQYDNKYTVQSPQGEKGILDLREGLTSSQPFLFLVEGWQYYANRLLTPEAVDIESPQPDQYLFIGQYGGFDRGGLTSPHGSASYRLTIQIPSKPAFYTLAIPEIFSSYRCYINGKLVAQMGNPDPADYKAETGNTSVTIEAANYIDILFAVSDYSHLYSGIVYPPVFGEPSSVAGFLNTRLIVRALLCASAFAVCILSVLSSLLYRKTPLPLLFSLLCFFFICYIVYPITKTLPIHFEFQYVMENFAFCAMLCIVMLLTMLVCNFRAFWGRIFIFFGIFMCIASLLVHALLPFGNLRIMYAYSILISIYEWSAAAFISFVVFFAVRIGMVSVKPLLYGIAVFNCALLMDRVLPLYEPIYTGWFIELASFVLVCCVGFVIVQNVVSQYREGIITAERVHSMERLYQSQLSYYETLKQGIESTKAMRHDLRHHFTVISGLIQQKQYPQLGEYLSECQDSYSVDTTPEYCPISVINILTYHYETIARQNKIELNIRCETDALLQKNTPIQISDADLCCLYSNLVENALEACMRTHSSHPFIRISVVCPAPDRLTIQIWNTAKKVYPVGQWFHSSKESGQSGYGLLSIKNIAQKHAGTASFHWNAKKNEFESHVNIMI